MDEDERDQPCFFWRHFSVIVPARLLCSCSRNGWMRTFREMADPDILPCKYGEGFLRRQAILQGKYKPHHGIKALVSQP